MRAINLIQIPNLNLNLKILIWKTNKDIRTICRMSKNIKQIFIIKDVIKPNLPLIFFKIPSYAHLMGQPTFSCRYRARTIAKITGQKLRLQRFSAKQISSVDNESSCNNLAFPLTCALSNKLIYLPHPNPSSSANTRMKIDGLD